MSCQAAGIRARASSVSIDLKNDNKRAMMNDKWLIWLCLMWNSSQLFLIFSPFRVLEPFHVNVSFDPELIRIAWRKAVCFLLRSTRLSGCTLQSLREGVTHLTHLRNCFLLCCCQWSECFTERSVTPLSCHVAKYDEQLVRVTHDVSLNSLPPSLTKRYFYYSLSLSHSLSLPRPYTHLHKWMRTIISPYILFSRHP